MLPLALTKSENCTTVVAHYTISGYRIPNAITRMKLLFSLFFSLVITSSAISIQQSDDLQSWYTIDFTVLNEQQEVEKLIVTVELPKESKGFVQLQVSAEITP